MNQGKEIAETTLKYLGGSGRLMAMIGADQFSYDDNGKLRFTFKMYKKANIVEFELDGMDLYTIRFIKFNKGTGDFKVVNEIDGLYFDQLKEVFEEVTGLYLSL